jgi:UDP-N-acetylmuramate--alanine ligase
MSQRPTPFELGPVHFVGIGGIGMSGIAEIMLRLGYQVQGSDARAGANTDRLQSLGATVFIGHAAEHIAGAAAVVHSSAIKPDNPEMAAARTAHIPLVRRAEMLAELMRAQTSIAIAGAHGKTTTTSMVAAVLEGGGLDPTVVNGGVINAYGANAKIGQGDWIVVEADESDGAFLTLRCTVAVVTNIDREHLDHYGGFEALKKAFRDFVQNIPFYSFAVLCTDDHFTREVAEQVENRRLVAYGLGPEADVRAVNLAAGPGGSRFDIAVSSRGVTLAGFSLPMPGLHNVRNALAAVAIGLELGVAPEAIRAALASFGGVRRRFTTTGVVGDVRVIDDYGHHPAEIAAVLAAAREAAGQGKVVAVVQPHRYTRLRDLMADFAACFGDADAVIIADVYAAGEAPIAGFDRDALVAAVTDQGHPRTMALVNLADLPGLIAAETQAGDLVVFLGAGDITAWAHALPAQLEALADAA